MASTTANPLWPGFTRSGGSTLGPDWVRPAPTLAQQRFDVIAVVLLLPLFWLRFQLTTSVGLWQVSDRAAFEAMVWSVVLGLAFAVRRRYPLGSLMYAILAASLAQSNRLDEAYREAKLFLASNPRFTITHWALTQPIRDIAVRDHFIDGYRKAGLPE